MKLLLLAIAVMLPFSASYADETIDGAFGIKFNDKYEKASGDFEHYKVKPNKKFSMFDKYYVSLAPKTKEVYSITGEGDVQTTCRQDVSVIKTALESKYDFDNVRIYTENIETSPDRAVTFKKDKVRIVLTCSHDKDLIAMTYINMDSERSAEEQKNIILDKTINDRQKDLNLEGL